MNALERLALRVIRNSLAPEEAVARIVTGVVQSSTRPGGDAFAAHTDRTLFIIPNRKHDFFAIPFSRIHDVQGVGAAIDISFGDTERLTYVTKDVPFGPGLVDSLTVYFAQELERWRRDLEEPGFRELVQMHYRSLVLNEGMAREESARRTAQHWYGSLFDQTGDAAIARAAAVCAREHAQRDPILHPEEYEKIRDGLLAAGDAGARRTENIREQLDRWKAAEDARRRPESERQEGGDSPSADLWR